jgi:hypothetical protein
MWFPCFHHILELVLGAYIQGRWKTSGPRDAIYTRFAAEWQRLLEMMPDILEASKDKVGLVAPEDDVTRKLHADITSLLHRLLGKKMVPEEEEEERLAESEEIQEGEETGKEETGEDQGAIGGESSQPKIPRGDYLEFIRLVGV